MRKTELVHVHALLAQVRCEFEAREEIRGDVFSAYEAYGVAPVAINQQKEHHQRAIALLLDGFRLARERGHVDLEDASSGLPTAR